MLGALHTAATGMKVHEVTVDNIANNLANANTTGFKKSNIEFQDLLYLNLGNRDGVADNDRQISNGLQIGSGAKAVSNVKTFTQGALEESNRQLDVAIDGVGFFQVTSGENIIQYTRDGSFKIDAERRLVTSGGQIVFPEVTLPENFEKVIIGSDGTVSVKITGQDELQVVAELTLAKFPNDAGLSSTGGNLFDKTPASGEPLVVRPGTDGVGLLRQGFLERSNVDTVSEMVKLIVAQRAYEINSRVIRSGDDMLSMVNSLIK